MWIAAESAIHERFSPQSMVGHILEIIAERPCICPVVAAIKRQASPRRGRDVAAMPLCAADD
jgi:hypothetical protein